MSGSMEKLLNISVLLCFILRRSMIKVNCELLSADIKQ